MVDISPDDIAAAQKLLALQNADTGAGVFAQPVAPTPIGPPASLAPTPTGPAHDSPSVISPNIPMAAPPPMPSTQASPPAPSPPPTNPNIAAARAVLAQSTPAPTLPTISAANPLQGPEAKDARASEINSKFDSAKANIQSQLAQEQAKINDGSIDGNPNKVAALQVQLNQIDKEKTNSLSANDAAFKAYVKDDSGTHLDASQLGNLSPRQRDDYQALNQKLELGNQKDALGKEQDAIKAQNDAAISANNAKAAFYDKQGQIQATQAQELAERNAVRQASIQQQQNAIAKSVQDYSSSKIDPNKVYENTSTGAKIATTLLAGLVGGLNGLNNVAGNGVITAIDNIVARDIDAQKTNIATKGKSIEMQNSALSQFMQQGFDQEQAISMAHAAAYQAASTQLQGILAQSDNASVKAQGQQTLSQLNEKQAQYQAQALSPYINKQLADRTVVAGTGQKGFSPAVNVGGVWQVKNLATGKISEATAEQVQAAKNLGKTDAETDKLKSAANGGGKVSPKIAVALANHDNAIDKVADFQKSYDDSLGTNIGLLDPEFQQKRTAAAEALSKVNGKPIEQNEKELSEIHIGPKLKTITTDLNQSRERLVGESKNSGVEGVSEGGNEAP